MIPEYTKLSGGCYEIQAQKNINTTYLHNINRIASNQKVMSEQISHVNTCIHFMVRTTVSKAAMLVDILPYTLL